MEPNHDEVLKALEQVIDPELRRPVTELDMVRDVEIHDGVVAFTIVLTVAGCPLRDSFEQQVEQALAGVAGVTGVELSFDVMTPEERQALTQKLRGGAPERDGVIRLPGAGTVDGTPVDRAPVDGGFAGGAPRALTGRFVDVEITGAEGPDLEAVLVAAR